MFYGVLTNHSTHVRFTTIEGPSHDHVLITWWLWLIRSRDWSCDMIMWSLCTCCHVTNFGQKYTRPWQNLWHQKEGCRIWVLPGVPIGYCEAGTGPRPGMRSGIIPQIVWWGQARVQPSHVGCHGRVYFRPKIVTWQHVHEVTWRNHMISHVT